MDLLHQTQIIESEKYNWVKAKTYIYILLYSIKIIYISHK